MQRSTNLKEPLVQLVPFDTIREFKTLIDVFMGQLLGNFPLKTSNPTGKIRKLKRILVFQLILASLLSAENILYPYRAIKNCKAHLLRNMVSVGRWFLKTNKR